MVKTKKAKFDFLVPSPSFSSQDVSSITGVSLRQLQWWDEKKVVSPRQEGHRRLYLAEEVLEISLIAELRRKGFSLQKIRRVLRFMQKQVGKRLMEVLDEQAELHLVTDGKTIHLEEDAKRIIDLMKNARLPMFLVCISDQIRRISETLPANRKPVGRELSVAHPAKKARIV